ncbi:MAG TPA: 30S ribosomal protein S20 [bacterium]|nr:30S ribosomal protein S20 [bacterium]
MATDRLRKKIGKGRHASSIKRDRQNEKLRQKNRSAVSRMKSAVKKVRADRSEASLKEAVPVIARTASKGVVHKKTASRLISRLTKAVRQGA